jgi:hypothetical protein
VSDSDFRDSVKTLGYCLLFFAISFVAIQLINRVRDATEFPYESESEQLLDRKWDTEEEIYTLLEPLTLDHAELRTEFDTTEVLRQEAKDAHEQASYKKPAPGSVIGRRRGGQFYPNERYRKYIEANQRAMGRDSAVNQHIRWTANKYYTLLESPEHALVVAEYAKILEEDELMKARWQDYSESSESTINGVMIIIGIPFAAAVFILGLASPLLLIGTLISFADRGDENRTF